MELRLFSTCPESERVPAHEYLHRVRRAARLAEAAGHDALLVPSDNRLLDPWVVAQEILRATRRLRPLVTVQPVYMHPYSVAKKVTSLTRLYGRSPDLNLVAGDYRTDLIALGEAASHDERYRRLTEYALVIRELLSATRPIEHEGEFYCLHRPAGIVALPDELMPRMLVAGSSPAGRAMAGRLGALTVRHPATDAGAPPITGGDCLRLGILARPTADEAWEIAHSRFVTDPVRRLEQRLEMRFTDSVSHRQLGQAVDRINADSDSPYWLAPFENRQAPCSYLVGDYATVAREIRGFLRAGVRSFLLDDPTDAAELRHTDGAFRRAWARHVSPLTVTA